MHDVADAELVRLDDLDDLEDIQADGDIIAVEFTELMAGINPATLSRGDYLRLKDILRDHPAVDEILDDWNHDGDDDAALEALSATLRDILPDGAIPVPSDGLRAASVYLEAGKGHLRRCQWAGCSEPAKERAGPRGPHPRWCDEHTKARKQWQDSGGSKAREQYRACCLEYQQDSDPSHTGLCPQHRDHRDVVRELAWLDYPLDVIADVYLKDHLGEGFHIEPPAPPRGWHSARGPWEGRTRESVFHADPHDDEKSAQWLRGNREWITGQAE